MAANLTQILNFKANFHQEFKLFAKKKIYANNGGHFKIVSIMKTEKGLQILLCVESNQKGPLIYALNLTEKGLQILL